MEAAVRVRLKLDDSVLTDSQKCEATKRWWVSIEPTSHRTVSDLVSHILHSFQLSDACPNGILLSMDGFVLPLFESIAIFTDNDLLCVKTKGSTAHQNKKRKGSTLLDVVKDQTAQIAYQGFHTKPHSREEDNLEIGNEPVRKKKRKLQNEHPRSFLQNNSPNCKQEKVCNSGIGLEGTVIPSKPDRTGNVSVFRSTRRKKAQRKYRQAAKQEQLLKKQSPGKEVKELDGEDHPIESDLDTGDEIVPVVVRPGHIRFAAPGKEKKVQRYQEAEVSFNWHGIMNNKKGKKWEKQKQIPSTRNENKNQAASKWNECGAPRNNQSNNKWNKLKSPKESQSISAWDGNRSIERQSSRSKWNDNRTHHRNGAAQNATPAIAVMDYEKLVPMTDFPVQGDTIAYRLLGMSSPFCPQLTSYRVGEVSWSDQESNMVLLVPIPEYPFEFNATKDTSGEQCDTSRYNEDGSLKIDFPSLADVRIVKRGGLNSTLHHTANGTPVSGWNCSSSASGWGNDKTLGSKVPSYQAKSTCNKWSGRSTAASASGWGSTSESGWRTDTPESSKDHQQPMSNNWTEMNTTAAASSSENGNKDVWEEISAAYIAKKEERLQEDNWNKKRKPVGNSWPYRTFRSSVRPTKSMSRAPNGCREN